jgi:hypothetical protein
MLEAEDEMLVGKVLICNSYILPSHNKLNQIYRSSTQINIMQHYKFMLFQETHVSPFRHTIIPYLEWRAYILSMDLGHVSRLETAYNKNILAFSQHSVLHSTYFQIPYNVQYANC